MTAPLSRDELAAHVNLEADVLTVAGHRERANKLRQAAAMLREDGKKLARSITSPPGELTQCDGEDSYE